MSEISHGPLRVLVVDDNRDAANALAVLLEMAGYEVETSFSGLTALEVARRFRPDACLLDINMPGMDGYELARRLRQLNPDNPPILATVTAYSDDMHLDRAVDAGFDLHFTKPANFTDVIDQLTDCVGR
jgi:two-component system, OmpR family, response regulator